MCICYDAVPALPGITTFLSPRPVSDSQSQCPTQPFFPVLHYFLPPPSFSPPSLFPLIRNNVSIFQQTVRLYLVLIPIQLLSPQFCAFQVGRKASTTFDRVNLLAERLQLTDVYHMTRRRNRWFGFSEDRKGGTPLDISRRCPPTTSIPGAIWWHRSDPRVRAATVL